jgi:hypothetical protein
MDLVLRALSRTRASRRETSGPSATCAAMAGCTSAISRKCRWIWVEKYVNCRQARYTALLNPVFVAFEG